MKFSFVFPRFRYESGDPPLGIAYLTAYLKKYSDWEISIYDTTFHHSFEKTKNYLSSKKPDIMGIYLDTIMYNDALHIIKYAKKQGIFIIAGGPHATILPESLIEYVDIVMLGEGELSLKKIIQNYQKKSFGNISNIWYKKEGRIIKNKRVYEDVSLDTYPYPARKLLDMEKYIKRCHQFDSINPKLRATTMIVSRGCIYNCSFCQPTLKHIFGSSVRIRSPKNILDEIREIKRGYNIDAIFFHDDTLTANMKWMTELCRALQKSNLNLIYGCNTRIDTINEELLKAMHRAGFRELHMGIESASQRILNEVYRKGIKISEVKATLELVKKIGFNTMCFFMIGAPSESRKEMHETIRFAAPLPVNEISVSIANPIPETDLYSYMKGCKYTISKNYTDFDYYAKQGFDKKGKSDVGLPDLKYYQKLLLLKFYGHPRHWPYIMKHAVSIKGLKKMVIKLRRFR